VYAICACADRGPGIAGAGALAAAPSQAQPVLVLHDPNVWLDLQAQGLAWVDADAKAKAGIALLMVRRFAARIPTTRGLIGSAAGPPWPARSWRCFLW